MQVYNITSKSWTKRTLWWNENKKDPVYLVHDWGCLIAVHEEFIFGYILALGNQTAPYYVHRESYGKIKLNIMNLFPLFLQQNEWLSLSGTNEDTSSISSDVVVNMLICWTATVMFKGYYKHKPCIHLRDRVEVLWRDTNRLPPTGV